MTRSTAIGLPLAALVATALGALLGPRSGVVYAPGPGDVTPAAARSQEEPGGEQDGEPEDPTDAIRDPVLRAKAKRVAALTASLPGAWRLTEMTPAPPAQPPVRVSGILVVTEHVLSLIAHGVSDASLTGETRELVQAGAHYWRIGTFETLEMAAVMGHDNFDGDLVAEPRLEPREYEISLMANRLTLSRRDGARLVFERFDVNSFPPEAARFVDALRSGRDPADLRR
jgi:hypothetical protein